MLRVQGPGDTGNKSCTIRAYTLIPGEGMPFAVVHWFEAQSMGKSAEERGHSAAVHLRLCLTRGNLKGLCTTVSLAWKRRMPHKKSRELYSESADRSYRDCLPSGELGG